MNPSEPTGQQPEAKLTDADKQWLAGWSVETPPTEYDSAFLTGAEAGIRYVRKQMPYELRIEVRSNERLRELHKSLSTENAQLRAEVERHKDEIGRLREQIVNDRHEWGAEVSEKDKRIAELEARTNAFIKTLEIAMPNVAAPIRETFELAIAKAKDKLHGNGKA